MMDRELRFQIRVLHQVVNSPKTFGAFTSPRSSDGCASPGECADLLCRLHAAHPYVQRDLVIDRGRAAGIRDRGLDFPKVNQVR